MSIAPKDHRSSMPAYLIRDVKQQLKQKKSRPPETRNHSVCAVEEDLVFIQLIPRSRCQARNTRNSHDPPSRRAPTTDQLAMPNVEFPYLFQGTSLDKLFFVLLGTRLRGWK